MTSLPEFVEFQSLPYEIIEQIYSLLSDCVSDVLSLELVNKRWRFALQRSPTALHSVRFCSWLTTAQIDNDGGDDDDDNDNDDEWQLTAPKRRKSSSSKNGAISLR
jgi:hypothetical protein